MVVRRHGHGVRFLPLRAYNHWDFPKGEVEPGEEPLSAAQREVAEETGLADLHFSWGCDYLETPPYARGKVARYYLAEAPVGDVTLAVNPLLGRPEHHEFRWLDYAAARRTLAGRLKPILDWAHARLRREGAEP